MDLFVYMIGDGSLVMPAMSGAGLAPRTLGLTLGCSAGEWSGLPPGGTLRGFQFSAQPFVLLLEPPILLLQLLNPSAGPLAFFPRTPQLLHQFSDAADRVEGFEKQIIL